MSLKATLVSSGTPFKVPVSNWLGIEPGPYPDSQSIVLAVSYALLPA